MNPTATVLVVTPSIGGYYFSELLAGMTREITDAGGRLVVVQTLDVGAILQEAGDPGLFDLAVAWSEVDGVVSVNSAVPVSYLQRMRDAGKSVVLAGAVMPGFAAPIAMPDNHGGTFAAVEHLLGLGHTRIGFVGNLAQIDIRERYVAYLEALATYDLVADPTHVYAASDNGLKGGVAAASELIACPDRPTAVMVATDRNAIGLVRTLDEAGIVIPCDLAIVAFDNTEAGAFTSPPLSSVNQRFDAIGSLAGRLVLAQIRGETVPSVVFTPQTAVVTVRESCGRALPMREGKIGGSRQYSAVAPELLRDELQDLLCEEVLTGHNMADGPLRDSVLAAVCEVESLLHAGSRTTTAEIALLMASLHRLTPRPDTLRRIALAMTEYVQRRRSSSSMTDGPASAATQVTAALWQLLAGALVRQAEVTQAAIEDQYLVDAGLVDTDRTDPGNLDWLAGTQVIAGALGLWDGFPSSGRLRIVGTYGPQPILKDMINSTVEQTRFPPASLIGLTRPAEREACVVVQVRTASRDWGLLAVIGQVDAGAAREVYQHWAALLAASLESQQLHDAVRKSALYDALTGMPNRRLFLDRLNRAISQQQRAGTPFAVLFLDLDGFKLINDSLGHPIGDRVLTAVGGRILRELRAVDTGARFGGDEFAILLDATRPRDALAVAQRVQKALATVLTVDGHDISVRASFGVATSTITYSTAEDVLRDADSAMYRAKAAEPGTVVVFDESSPGAGRRAPGAPPAPEAPRSSSSAAL